MVRNSKYKVEKKGEWRWDKKGIRVKEGEKGKERLEAKKRGEKGKRGIEKKKMEKNGNIWMGTGKKMGRGKMEVNMSKGKVCGNGEKRLERKNRGRESKVKGREGVRKWKY